MGDLTPGHIYFIEKEAAQQDWGTEPDDIVIGNFTEGTHYCKFSVPRSWNVVGHTGTLVSTIGGGIQYSLRQARRYYDGGATGLMTSIKNANLIDAFFMSKRHTSGKSSVFVPYYLICYHGLNSSDLCTMFTDHTGTQRAYCRLEAVKFQRGWVDTEILNVKCNISFLSVWQ